MISKKQRKIFSIYFKHMLPYSNTYTITEQYWNNAFAWEQRWAIYQKQPTLTIPSLIQGTISDVQIGEDIVFEEVENGSLQSCIGLKNFVQLSTPSQSGIPPIAIFDNHNHALYFWIEAVRTWIIAPSFELIHIDEHSDLWENTNHLQLEKAIQNPQYAWEFTNKYCNVGNYIKPAIIAWLVWSMVRIENEYQIDEYMNYNTKWCSVLNIDIDIFAPELDHIPEGKKIQIIRNLMQKVQYITIATSPFFIDQKVAMSKIRKILS